MLEDIIRDLPEVVQRYFKKVFQDNTSINIHSVRLSQEGQLRTSKEGYWMNFSASESIVADERSFQWKAKVKIPMGLHITVIDRYKEGIGTGQVKLLSIIPMGFETNRIELNSGALHRYLAEGVWCPTVLLPINGVRWSAINDDSAEASLSVGESTVSLEFRFNDDDEVISVYSDGRYGKFKKGYQKKAWEGHFNDYREVNGIRIPFYGEVGWWDADQLDLVWKGRITKAEWDIKN